MGITVINQKPDALIILIQLYTQRSFRIIIRLEAVALILKNGFINRQITRIGSFCFRFCGLFLSAVISRVFRVGRDVLLPVIPCGIRTNLVPLLVEIIRAQILGKRILIRLIDSYLLSHYQRIPVVIIRDPVRKKKTVRFLDHYSPVTLCHLLSVRQQKIPVAASRDAAISRTRNTILIASGRPRFFLPA